MILKPKIGDCVSCTMRDGFMPKVATWPIGVITNIDGSYISVDVRVMGYRAQWVTCEFYACELERCEADGRFNLASL